VLHGFFEDFDVLAFVLLIEESSDPPNEEKLENCVSNDLANNDAEQNPPE
jgi:hypothetical protein